MRFSRPLLLFLLASVPLRAQDWTAVDERMNASLGDLGGGAALTIVTEGEVLHEAYYGNFAAGRVLPIASATKWLSGAVIMSLVDDGLLSLDDPVGRYLPEFTGDKGAMTIRQLMSHTSGLPGDYPCIGNPFISLEACVAEIAKAPLVAKPGTEFRYGGVSMQVAGRIAEVASGKPWITLFRQRIGTPLGMRSTDYYAFGLTANPRIGGSARCTLAEYGRFLMMILGHGRYFGKRILSEGSVRQMLSDQTRGAAIVETPYASYAYLDPTLPLNGYGIGCWVESPRLTEFSSQGAFGFSPWVDLERGVGGVMMVVDRLQDAMPVYLDLKKLVREQVPVEAPRRRGVRTAE